MTVLTVAADDELVENSSRVATTTERDDLVAASLAKLRETAASLQTALRQGNGESPNTIRLRPCRTPAEAQGYRCRCSFQIVANTAIADKAEPRFQYAIREQGQPVVIHDFDVANERIRASMRQLLAALQDDGAALSQHLTSVTFCTSWNPGQTCLLTLHYRAPFDHSKWKTAARQVATTHGWQQVTGRSKGCVVRAVPEKEKYTIMLRDTLYLQHNNEPQGWQVSLDATQLARDVIDVHYVKPESAFCHPNATVMCQAVSWMLNRIETICGGASQRPTLLELYCGCGAHTMALLRSGLLHRIVAVELDERLVQACRDNLKLNGLDNDRLQIISQDAGTWSSAATAPQQASILLVDPPRQGLDARVCRMALQQENLQDLLYISCGRDALVRDLRILQAKFDVVDCVLLDLFPQTYSVESLVHLQRRQ